MIRYYLQLLKSCIVKAACDVAFLGVLNSLLEIKIDCLSLILLLLLTYNYLAWLSGMFSLSDWLDPSVTSLPVFPFLPSKTIAFVLLKKWGAINLRRLSDISIPIRFSYALASLSLASEMKQQYNWIDLAITIIAEQMVPNFKKYIYHPTLNIIIILKYNSPVQLGFHILV